MNRYERLMDSIRAGGTVLIDGATGTEVERRGVPQLENAWNGGGALSHPDVLRSVHEDYIREGAEIVISNSFATHRHALRDAGVEDDFEALNRRGVELAIEARERARAPVWRRRRRDAAGARVDRGRLVNSTSATSSRSYIRRNPSRRAACAAAIQY